MEDYRAQDRWTLVPDSRSVGGVDWLPMVERGRRMKPGERVEVVPAEQLRGAVERAEKAEAEYRRVNARAFEHRAEIEQLAGAVGALEQARLYGEKMARDPDETVRRCGADLVALIDVERGR